MYLLFTLLGHRLVDCVMVNLTPPYSLSVALPHFWWFFATPPRRPSDCPQKSMTYETKFLLNPAFRLLDMTCIQKHKRISYKFASPSNFVRKLDKKWYRKANLFVGYLNVSTVNADISIRFMLHNIQRAITDFNPKAVPGFYKINNKILFDLNSKALIMILFIFNAILRLEYFSSVLNVFFW